MVLNRQKFWTIRYSISEYMLTEVRSFDQWGSGGVETFYQLLRGLAVPLCFYSDFLRMPYRLGMPLAGLSEESWSERKEHSAYLPSF